MQCFLTVCHQNTPTCDNLLFKSQLTFKKSHGIPPESTGHVKTQTRCRLQTAVHADSID